MGQFLGALALPAILFFVPDGQGWALFFALVPVIAPANIFSVLLIAYLVEVINSRIDARDALIESRDTANQANRAKDEFLAVMSHELRTPLNPILGFADLLEAQTQDREHRRYLGLIADSAKRQLALIDDILNYTRLDRHKIDPGSESFSIVRVCERCVASIQRDPDVLDVTFENHLDQRDGDWRVIGDPLILGQIIDNYLSNAVKFTPEGSVKLCLRLSRPPNRFRIEVEDTGIGIESDKTGMIFEPFAQVDASAKRAYGGLGLGLAISKKLADAVGAQVGCSSVLDQGSAFWLEIELKPAEDVPVEESDIVALNALQLAGSADVLVVDDNRSNVDVLTSLIRLMGGTTVGTTSVAESLQLLKKRRFDLLLLDLHMPVMSGLELGEEVRRHNGPNRATPIVVVSADGTVSFDESFREAGIDDFILKPISLETLHGSLTRLL